MRMFVLNALIFGTLLATAVASSLLTIWHSHQSQFWDTRIALAQNSYAEHLALQANINRLFKQNADALLFGDQDRGSLEASLTQAIRDNVATIRSIIAHEIDLVGEEEFQELDDLARIEAKVAHLTNALRRLAADGVPVDSQTRRNLLIDLMDREIDERLNARIEDALAGERAEVAETLAEAERFRRLVQRAAWGLIGISVLLSGAAVFLYHRKVLQPARAVMAATERFQKGDFETPPPLAGAYELRKLAETLGEMAFELRERQKSQAEHTHSLEEAVATRTAEMSRLLAQFERSEATRRQMMTDVSHELRTPLTIIQGEADVSLRTGVHPAAVYRETLERIRETARHANAIVDDLMLIARQEAGNLRLNLSEVDLCQLAKRTADLAGRAIAIDLTVPTAVVKADPVRIRQCLLALLQNAFRYGGETITLRIEAVAAGYRVTVEDNGPGMSKAEKAEAFDRFFRGTNAAVPTIEGTGLGLPIVRSITLAHGGTCGLDDRPGGGLQVWIQLPAKPVLRLLTAGPTNG